MMIARFGILQFCLLLIISNGFSQSCQNLLDSASVQYDLENFDRAKVFCENAFECTQNNSSNDDVLTGQVLNVMANILCATGEFTRADSLYKQAVEILEKNNENASVQYVSLLVDYADCLSENDKLDESFVLGMEAVDIGRTNTEINDELLGEIIFKLAGYYMEKANYDLAEQYGTEALELTAKGEEPNSVTYGDVQVFLASVYVKKKNYDDALPLYESALEIYDLNGLASDENYTDIQANLASVYVKLDFPEKAIPLYVASFNTLEDFRTEKSQAYMAIGINLAMLYEANGLYEEAIPYYIKALDAAKSDDGLQKYVGFTFGKLSGVFRKLGQYNQALEYAYLGLEESDLNSGKESMAYSKSLKELSQVYLDLGNYDKALLNINESISIVEKIQGKNSMSYGSVLSVLGSIYRRQEELVEALAVQREVLSLVEKIRGADSPSYASSLNNVGMILLNMDSLSQAIAMFEEAIELTEIKLGVDNINIMSYQNNLADAYENSNDYQNALMVYQKVLQATENSYGKGYTYYAPRLMSVARCYDKLDSTESAFLAYEESMSLTINDIDRNFNFISENGREDFLIRVGGRFNELQDFFYRHKQDFPHSKGLAYNLELTTKGMLLSSVSEVRNAVRASRDTTLINQYEEWMSLRTLLNKQYELPIAKRRADLNDFEATVDRMEGEISNSVRNSGSQSAGELSNWQDVQSMLEKGSVAIEFLFIESMDNDSSQYVALILLPGEDEPLEIGLCKKHELQEIFDSGSDIDVAFVSDTYRGAGWANTQEGSEASLYDLIWKPIEQFIPKKSTVYFAPTGMLHKVAFAALKNQDNRYLYEEYSLRQVTSTGNLLNKQATFDINESEVLIMGGMNYGIGEWRYLPATLYETDAIEGLAGRKGLNSEYLLGDLATESNFKKFGPSKQIIHLATHGFYYEWNGTAKNEEPMESENIDSTSTNMDRFEGLRLSENPNPLQRSGLIMTGGNEYWNKQAPLLGDDNILTAAEIANMELQNADLVVLSACETGLGDIQGNEGVYGLHRGFKMAGAKTLVYSLWTVPDNETFQFMELFYSALFKGKEIREAFDHAQREMAKNNTPYYWAGFILVD